MEELSKWDIVSIVGLIGMLVTGLWGGIRDYQNKKDQGTTRQSNRPESYDKRLEDRY